MTLSPEILRAGIFIGVLLSLIGLEALFPRRAAKGARKRRRAVNLALFVSGVVIGRVLIFAAAVSAALWAQNSGFGVLNLIEMPLWLAIAITIFAMDFLVWCQHVASHLWPPLWRLHRMHHSDVHMDVTTALRFHPVEIGLSLLFKAGCVVLLGAPIAGVIAFEILLNSCAMFNHANINLPPRADRILRKVIATPDMHRVHHSPPVRETNSNYATFLTVWDYLFGTYVAQPEAGHVDGDIGLREFRSEQDQTLTALLAVPLAPIRPKSRR